MVHIRLCFLTLFGHFKSFLQIRNFIGGILSVNLYEMKRKYTHSQLHNLSYTIDNLRRMTLYYALRGCPFNQGGLVKRLVGCLHYDEPTD